MSTAMHYLTTISVLAVLVVLILGLLNLLRSNSANLSQTLMRWRVGLQFLAILIIMVTVYITRS